MTDQQKARARRAGGERAARYARFAVAGVMLCLARIGVATDTTKPTEPPQATAAAPAQAAPALRRVDTSSYLIGPGDSIQIFVWRNPELTVLVPVRPDGKVSAPLVEDMVAVGKTPTQLARDIEQVLGEYVRSPQVNVIVTNAQSAFNQIKVIGQVAQPKSVAYREGMTVLDVMLDVGGLTPFAAGNRAKILRKDAKGVQQTIKVRLDDLMKKGRATDNPPMKPGDILVVPEAMF